MVKCIVDLISAWPDVPNPGNNRFGDIRCGFEGVVRRNEGTGGDKEGVPGQEIQEQRTVDSEGAEPPELHLREEQLLLEWRQGKVGLTGRKTRCTWTWWWTACPWLPTNCPEPTPSRSSNSRPSSPSSTPTRCSGACTTATSRASATETSNPRTSSSTP